MDDKNNIFTAYHALFFPRFFFFFMACNGNVDREPMEDNTIDRRIALTYGV
ncbi:MAG: hypothetical protein LBL04_10365 [Bacteroidales bacterium]|jgi:hypothetical protein|nr:hypothetical protein [Bacteroidales bacterium]